MKSYPYIPSMVQAITVLTVLKMMTKAQMEGPGFLAQTSCGSGSLSGKVMYERMPNTQLHGYDDDVVRDTAPPFMVLEKCQDLCLRDRASNNIVRTCASFDFQPGSRIATYNGGPEYEESMCYLTREQAQPEGIGNLILVPNNVLFNEVCITSNRPERECPNRRYIFERHPRKKLKLPEGDMKGMPANNRTECEDKCLNEFSFVCRSATFDSVMHMCFLSRFTRRTHPELLEDDPNSDYLENMCLNAERRCDGLAVFIKEENKRLGGPFEVDLFSNITLEDCQSMCVRAEKYFCRSIEYDEMTKQCTISEEDSISQKDDIGISSSPTHHFYDFACLDSPRGSEYPDNSVTSHLFTGKRPDTAFQRYRNSRLGGEHHSEISGRSLSECLDECLRQPSFQCRSAVYSERYRTCRLSRYNQKDGMRIIYDADYDYYENLMLGNDDGGRPGDSGGPGDRYPSHGGDRYPSHGGDRYPSHGGDRYPSPGHRPGGSRYPPSGGGDYGGGRYPPSSHGSDHGGRYPSPGDRYPPSHFGGDRYPPSHGHYPSSHGGDYGGGRYPPSSHGGDRYPPPSSHGVDRYPPPPSSHGGDRYPPPSRLGGDRYPSRRPGYDRYPDDNRYPTYPDDRDRYPPRDRDRDRYPARPGDRYPDRDRDRYPDRDRDRYPDRDRDRYPIGPDRYPPSSGGGDRYRPGDRYPADSRYPYDEDDRYGSGGRYGDDRFPGDKFGGNRYGGNRYGDRDKYPGGGNKYDDRYGGKYGHRYDYYGDEKHGGSRWFFRPDRRPGGRPYDERPGYDGHRRPISPGPDGPIYDGPGGLPPGRPYSSRCDGGESFNKVGDRRRIRKEFVRRFTAASSLSQCQQECVETRDFICRSFNFRDGPAQYDREGERDNCELSDRDSHDFDIQNPQFFDTAGNFDFYERSNSRQGVDGDCLDVNQVCNEDGMEFTLKTPEGFYGRIYTYGFYDRCFFRGNGGTINVLRISGAQGYPECGTQRYGDTMTNIVVVQFSDFVQTGKDKRFNLTCIFRGPGEAVVSSGFIGAGSGSPIPIEYLPAENSLSSKVRLLILYQGRPTTTIAVGDPLTFRLEAQDGYNYVTDIFATNVVARDPYSGRSVQLIDRFGCPVDSYVFPELDRGRSGDTLEARFNAFKIPESNFLVFEATVRTCRDGCQPAYCNTGSGRSEPSFGRRKREINDTMLLESNNTISVEEDDGVSNETSVTFITTETKSVSDKTDPDKESEDPEYVREMIEVFDSREELQQEARRAIPAPENVCLTTGEYQGLITAVLLLAAILITVALVAGLAYRRYWIVMRKNIAADRSSSNMSSSYPTTRSSGISGFSGVSIFGTGLQKPFSGFGKSARTFPDLSKDDLDCPLPAPGGLFEDPSEPIYTDPSLFERSRSLRSIAVSQKRHSPGPS